MKAKSEQALVGLFVVAATAVLIFIVFAISGAFGRSTHTYRAYFPFAGGIESGSGVRYSGGPKIGRVETVRIDPQNPSRIEITFKVQSDLPVKTDSHVNDLLNVQNRANLSATLANARGMIEENRPALHSTLTHINSVSEKLEPLLSDFRKTSEEANKAIDHIDSLIGENRADIRQAVAELRRTLTNMTDLTAHLNQTLDVNSENIDELLDNFRHVSENLKEFTNTIKSRPYTLIRSSNPREHKPGERQ